MRFKKEKGKDMMQKQEYVCIVCPSSCRLTVEERDGAVLVTGNGCKRGLAHGMQEYMSPQRMLTTTVALSGAALSRLPVASSAEVPKARLAECLRVLYGIVAVAPVRCGDVIVPNICGTGVDVCASRTMERERRPGYLGN